VRKANGLAHLSA